MSQHVATVKEPRLNLAPEASSKVTFGFWIYIMTDCVLFASLFATYAVLHNNTFGGPAGAQLFNMPNVLAETLILLTSSFTTGLGMLAAQQRHLRKVIAWFGVTFVLGASFLTIELSEFSKLVASGNSWQRSGFLSSFFTLVGTHGLHITVGLLWMAILIAKIAATGLTKANVRRLTLLSLFWHFLDIVWIFIFTMVYMLGAI
jgi:cytochrome o ubiquinol oxidase subunit 3